MNEEARRLGIGVNELYEQVQVLEFLARVVVGVLVKLPPAFVTTADKETATKLIQSLKDIRRVALKTP